MRKRACGLALTLGLAWLAAFAVPVPAAVGKFPTWLAPQYLSGLDGSSVRHPKVAMDTGGNAVAVWERDSGGYRAIEAATREPGGDWSEPQQLSLPVPDSTDAQPEVAAGASGEMIAIWSSGVGGTDVLASSRPPGGAWSWPPVSLTRGLLPIPTPADSLQVEIGADGDALASDAVAIWFGDDTRVVVGAIGSVGGDWGDLQIIASKEAGARPMTHPRLALSPDGKATVIWATEGTGPNSNTIRAATRRPDQDSWGPPETLATDADWLGYPDIAVDRSGQATAVWQRTDGGDRVVQARTRSAYSSSWSSPVDLSVEGEDPPGPASECPRPQEPDVAAGPGGDTTVAWSCQTAYTHYVQARTRPAGASVWGETVDLSGPTPTGGHPNPYRPKPQVAVDARGSSVAIWSLCDVGGACTIQAADRPPGGAWSAPRDLSSPEQDPDSPPDLGGDGSGNMAAVWSGPEAVHGLQHEVVKAAGHDDAGPLLRGPSVPLSGLVDIPVEVSVSPLDVWSQVGLVEWGFGDLRWGVGTTARHRYRKAGTYQVTVQAFDTLGNPTTEGEREIKIWPIWLAP